MRLRRTMGEDEFWALVAMMQGRCDEQAVLDLTDALAAQGRRAARAFQERLATVLHDLDREVLASQPVRFPGDSRALPLSDDAFLYLRAGLVARGRETVAAVLADPELLAAGEWDECESLLYAAEEVTGDDIETRLSYETGENRAHWSPRPQEERSGGLRPAYVDVRDLTAPLEGEALQADGTWAVELLHDVPEWLEDSTDDELTTVVGDLLTEHGVPKHLGVVQVRVVVDAGDAWQLEPVVGTPYEDEEFGVGTVLDVTAAVRAVEVRGWSPEVRREALLAVAARCLLAVLPDGHGARPQARRLADDGAPHLPAPA